MLNYVQYIPLDLVSMVIAGWLHVHHPSPQGVQGRYCHMIPLSPLVLTPVMHMSTKHMVLLHAYAIVQWALSMDVARWPHCQRFFLENFQRRSRLIKRYCRPHKCVRPGACSSIWDYYGRSCKSAVWCIYCIAGNFQGIQFSQMITKLWNLNPWNKLNCIVMGMSACTCEN